MKSLTFHFMESDECFKSVFGMVSHRTPTVLATDVSADYGPVRTDEARLSYRIVRKRRT
jgi:hypothetical protein